MSSAVVSTSAALGRPFVFDDEAVSKKRPPTLSFRPPSASEGRRNLGFENLDLKLAKLTPASRLDVRPAPEMATSGIAAIDALTGGLPRGCLTEICGPASSGRTTLLLAALAAATRRGEFCAVVDASDALDPHSVAAAGVDLDRLLWVRCGENSPQQSPAKEKPSQAAFKFSQTASRQAEHCLEQLLRATDLLLESGGFGLIALDICDVTPQAARRIPLTTWFRFRRAVEHKPTVLLAFEQNPIAGSCSSLLLKLSSQNNPEGTMKWNHSDCRATNTAFPPVSTSRSPEGATFISPEPALSLSKGRKSGVAEENRNKSRRDDRNSDTDSSQNVYSSHTQLLTKLKITANLDRSRLERKPARSTAAFTSKTAWAG